MYRFTVAACSIMLISLLGGAGCSGSKLRFEDKVALKPGEEKPLSVDAPKKDQNVQVEASAPETFNIEVALEKSRIKPLAKKSNVKTFSSTVTIPAGEKFLIILKGADKETQVKVSANSVE